MRLLDEEVIIRANRKITPHLYVVSFQSKPLARLLQPGQFLQVGVSSYYDPFLRRPFTVYRVSGDMIEILYEIVGRGTELLATLSPGNRLQVMGPLGNTFSMYLKRRLHVIVGGGVGIAPFVFLGQNMRIDHFLMGARSKDGLLPRSEMGKLWPKARFATDDGSFGEKGFVTGLLEELIRDTPQPERLYLFICGPRVMMKKVLELAARHGIQGEASVDERMACGVGACLGCVVKTTDGFKTTCREGTVFSFRKLIL